jgi:hypothetical protein
MEQKNIDPEIKNLTQELIDNGTKYNLEYLNNIYDEKLKFIRINKDDTVELLTKKDNMYFFESLKTSGAQPLNSFAEFHYADNDGKKGFIVLTRRMKQKDNEQEFLFNIYWEKMEDEWKIVRETVIVK